ncbi:hypothetical protein [Acetobacterium wieringae]|jgi:hypothetical protein|uniref:Uncharacterized protein n=1 Tax=Acetobacterium wieringae TaxID=52694 RepID=A0A1F2PJK0_9FIRM|nr:hypothetical protein [Acetobacterium wieringae]OFV71520.1 hypothetical protein ACWI_10200 [Acetobacterium wieringae]
MNEVLWLFAGACITSVFYIIYELFRIEDLQLNESANPTMFDDVIESLKKIDDKSDEMIKDFNCLRNEFEANHNSIRRQIACATVHSIDVSQISDDLENLKKYFTNVEILQNKNKMLEDENKALLQLLRLDQKATTNEDIQTLNKQ